MLLSSPNGPRTGHFSTLFSLHHNIIIIIQQPTLPSSPTIHLPYFSVSRYLRMLKVQVSSPPAEVHPQDAQPTLADLSRNASVISSSSSSSSTSDLTVQTPVRPRPIRTFTSPQRKTVRSRSPQSPQTPRNSKPPAYLARELGIPDDSEDKPTELRPPAPPRGQPRSRNSSVNGRISADDFEFGRVLGEGSYSTVSPISGHLCGVAM